MYPTRQLSRAAPRPTEIEADRVSDVVHKQTNNESEDVMVLQRWNGKLIAEQHYQPVGAPPAIIRKDMNLVVQEAYKHDMPMPFANIVRDRLTATVALGEPDVDWASFAKRVSEDAGL